MIMIAISSSLSLRRVMWRHGEKRWVNRGYTGAGNTIPSSQQR